tara:strand:+ start:5700 stop:5903 length:204 start_codon:yes stop_codon:yes gene_type:complete
MKQVDASFLVNFTTENISELPSARQMNHDLQELFAAALDHYLSDKNIEGNEVHLILCDDFTIEDYEE